MSTTATSRIADWLWIAAVSGAIWTGLFLGGVWLGGADPGYRVGNEIFACALIVAVSLGFRPGSGLSSRFRLVASSGMFVASAIGFCRSVYVTQVALTSAGA